MKVQGHWKRNTLPDENVDVIGKVKKFGICWCIPHRMTSYYYLDYPASKRVKIAV